MLQPNDPDSYYASRELVPGDMLDDVDRAKIVITNYHAFKLRERVELSKGGRALLQGRGRRRAGHARDRRPDAPAGHARADGHEEHPRPQRRGAPLLPREAAATRTRTTSKGDERKEAEKNNEAARLWISGLEAVNRKLGARARDRPLGDAVLPARLGLRRGHALPLDDERLLAHGRDRVRHREAAARPGRGQHPRRRDADVPQPLGAHPARTCRRRGAARRGRSTRSACRRSCRPRSRRSTATTRRPSSSGRGAASASRPASSSSATTRRPRSSSTTTSPASSGRTRTARRTLENGRLALFRNFDEHGNPLAAPEHAAHRQRAARDRARRSTTTSASMAADEIERFRREIVERTGDRRAAENLTDQELLREVMNTVGKPGPPGRVDPLRRLRLDAHRGLGREHRDPRPRRPRLRHAAPLRAGHRPRAAPAVLRPERGGTCSTSSTPTSSASRSTSRPSRSSRRRSRRARRSR